MPRLACGEDLGEEVTSCRRFDARPGDTIEASANKRVAIAQYKEVALHYTGPVIDYSLLGRAFWPKGYERRVSEAKARARQFVLAAVSAHQDAGWMFQGAYRAAVDETWTKTVLWGRPRFRGARVRLYRSAQGAESRPTGRRQQAVPLEELAGDAG